MQWQKCRKTQSIWLDFRVSMLCSCAAFPADTTSRTLSVPLIDGLGHNDCEAYMSWRVCSTPGCPNLIETPARKCDACTPSPTGPAPVPEAITPTAPRDTNHSASKCSHETHTAHAPATPDAEAAANTTDSAAIQAQSQTITHTKEPNSSTCDSTPTTRSSDEALCKQCHDVKTGKTRPAGFNTRQ